MKKDKSYYEVRFSSEVLREAILLLNSLAEKIKTKLNLVDLEVQHADAKWSYDIYEEFYADYRLNSGDASLNLYGDGLTLHIIIFSRSATVSFKAPDRAAIESFFRIFDRAAPESRLPPELSKQVLKKTSVFIGHGRSPSWRDLKDHLQDKHDVKVIAYETGARAGHSIRDILEDMIRQSSFAVLVMTGEDEQSDGAVRARQNVIHEVGLFQGKLGFSRAIMIVENGVEDFSNVHGIQQIRFNKSNIKETFGEVLATLRREFPSNS
jgi:predicted nucleotide-binding protein